MSRYDLFNILMGLWMVGFAVGMAMTIRWFFHLWALRKLLRARHPELAESLFGPGNFFTSSGMAEQLRGVRFFWRKAWTDLGDPEVTARCEQMRAFVGTYLLLCGAMLAIFSVGMVLLPPEGLEDPDRGGVTGPGILELDPPILLRVLPDGAAAGGWEVTNAQFRAFRPEHTSNRYQRDRFQGLDFDGDLQPAIVTRLEAVAYCAWASEQTGRTVRLPTAAEWERIARADGASTWTWGDDPSVAHLHANGADPTTFERFLQGDDATPQDDRLAADDGTVGTARYCSFERSPWAFCDLHGNVTEWTSTPYDEAAGAVQATPADPADPAQQWVLKGGAWNNGPGMMKTATNNWCNAGNHYDSIGFRVWVEPAPEGGAQ